MQGPGPLWLATTAGEVLKTGLLSLNLFIVFVQPRLQDKPDHLRNGRPVNADELLELKMEELRERDRGAHRIAPPSDRLFRRHDLMLYSIASASHATVEQASD